MKTLTVEELCKSIIDCPHSTPIWKDSGIRVIRNFNIKKGQLDFSDGYFVDEETYSERTKRALPETDDLVISREAPMGEVCIIPKNLKCCLGQRLVLLKVNKEKCFPKYLLYMMQSKYVQEQIGIINKTGSIVSNLNIPDLKALKIPYRPIESQQKIAAVLSALDDKIALNRRMNAKLEQMAKRLYDHWFVQFDFPNADGKPYKASGGKMEYNEVLKREIPAGWELVPMKSVIKQINTGLNPRDNFVLGKGEVKYITVKNLTEEGNIDYSNCDLIDIEAQKIVHERSQIQKGDILFASICPLGRCYLIQDNPTDWDINESVFSIRPNTEKLSSEFLYTILRDSYYVKKMTQKATGSIFKGIRINDIEKIEILLPPKELILAYDEKVNSIFSKQHVIEKENLRLIALRDRLLPLLMNGQVEVK